MPSVQDAVTLLKQGAAADKAHKADGISADEKSAKLSEAISIYEQGVGLLDEVLAQGKVKAGARAPLEKKREEVQKRIAQLRKKLGGSAAQADGAAQPPVAERAQLLLRVAACTSAQGLRTWATHADDEEVMMLIKAVCAARAH